MLALAGATAHAEVKGDAIRIGVLTDMVGAYAANTGQGSIIGARLAIEDFAKTNPGVKGELVSADLQLKPDAAVAIAGDWLDNQGVDLITDVPLSSAAFAIGDMVKSKDKVAIFTGGASAAITGDRCGPNHLHWVYDTWAMPHAVVDATVNGMDGVDVLRGLRARGFAGAAVLVVDQAKPPKAGDDASVARLGARRCSLDGSTLTSLAVAVADALLVEGDAEQATGSTQAAVKALRQTQRLMAAGELAMRLQHSINNPLAALLAEAQLLELEALPPDHRQAVERIIELCRRVVDVVRALDGVARA